MPLQRNVKAPAIASDITPATPVGKVAEPWFLELAGMVEEGQRSPGTPDAYGSIYRRHVTPALGMLRE